MKILYFSRGYTPHDHRFLTRLAESDHEVYFLHLEHNHFVLDQRPLPEAVRFVQPDGLEPVGNVFTLSKTKRNLKIALERINPDLVHAGPVQQGAFLTALVGFSPLVTMSWGSDLLLDAKRGLGRKVARYTLQRCTVFLCDCQAVARAAYELGVAEDRTVIFPWGVDLEFFAPNGDRELRNELGWKDEIVLLSTRTMEKIYGVELIAKAFVDLLKKDINVRLLVLGDGSLRGKIEQIFKQAGLEQHVHFAGKVGYSKLPDYYRAADLYVSASYVDGSSISLLEAMACGLPAVVSDIPGNLEWVTPEVNGWIFPAGSSKALCDQLYEAIQDPGEFVSRGKHARLIVEDRADWNRNSIKLLQAYDLAVKIYGEAVDG